MSTPNGPPRTIEAGNYVQFTETLASYPSTSWTMQFVLVQPGGTPVVTAATVSGSSFLVTLAGGATANLTPGTYEWVEYVTNGGNRLTARNGTLTALPNLAVAQTPSFAAAQVTLLQGAIAALTAQPYAMVNFNGQEFEYAKLADYQKQLVTAQAAVIRENAAAAAARGARDPGRIAIEFASPFDQCGRGTWST